MGRPHFRCQACGCAPTRGLDGVGDEWIILWDQWDNLYLHFCKPCRDDMGIPEIELGFGPGQNQWPAPKFTV